jgi:Uma2 family endonuclease
VPDDTEDAPWMVMADLQVRDVDLLKAILQLHIEQRWLPWYLASYLEITMRRPRGERDLIAAPDLMLAEAEDRLLSSWSVEREGKAPEFALEVSSDQSWARDTKDKPRIYRAMGVREYAVFAPERSDGGPKLFGYRRDDAGRWVGWRPDERGVLRSRALGGLGLYIEDDVWLRALDMQGNRLPTPREWAEAEAARARAEAAARAEERARREAAEAEARAQAEEAARLREELRRLREARGARPAEDGG